MGNDCCSTSIQPILEDRENIKKQPFGASHIDTEQSETNDNDDESFLMQAMDITIMPRIMENTRTIHAAKEGQYSLMGSSADCEKQDNRTNDNSEQEEENYSPQPGQSPKATCSPDPEFRPFEEGLDIILQLLQSTSEQDGQLVTYDDLDLSEESNAMA